MPFEIAPVQIAFILIGESPGLVNYYQKISDLLTPYYRCQLYNKNSRVNLNVLQADQEGCPFKIILGKEELRKEEITLVRRDDIERRIAISLASSEVEKKGFVVFEKYCEELSEIYGEEVKKEFEKNKVKNSFEKGDKTGKIFNIITKEVAEFNQVIYQKSADFRDKHIYPVDSFAELEKKIKEGTKDLFLIPFCNQLDCEIKVKERVPAYSIRCISEKEKVVQPKNCLFCQLPARHIVYLGRSY